MVSAVSSLFLIEILYFVLCSYGYSFDAEDSVHYRYVEFFGLSGLFCFDTLFNFYVIMFAKNFYKFEWVRFLKQTFR